MKKSLAILFVLTVCQAAFSQSPSGLDRIDSKIARLDSQVNLSEQQETQIRQIMVESRERIKTLQMDSNVSRTEIHQIRKDAREEVHNILTEEQKAKLPAKRGESERPNHHRGKYKMKGHSELKTDRLEFDSLLSTEEKNLIENARKMIHDTRKDSKGLNKDSISSEERKVLKQKKEQIFKSLDPVLDNHKEELLSIEMAHNERLKSIESERPNGQEHKRHKTRKGDKFSYRFLLMKP